MAEDGFSTVCVIDLLLGKKRIRTPDLRGGLATLRNTWAPVRKASRGPFVSRLGGGFGSCPCDDVWTSAAHFQDLLAPSLRAPETRQISICRRCRSAGCLASTLDPHHDLAPGKVIRSCPVASFNLLTKIDPADTISASAARYLIRSKFLPLAGAALPDASAGAALQIWGASPIGARSVRGSLMSEMGHSEKSALKSERSAIRLGADI